MTSSNGNDRINVLFVCLGNICRSPMAEAVFRDLVAKKGLSDHFTIQSAGMGDWHLGEPAHRGTREVLKRHDIDPSGLLAKSVTQSALDQADYIVAMDAENLSDLRAWQVDHAKLTRILDYTEGLDVRDVPDPYYDGRFELVYELIRMGSEGLLKHIREEKAL